MIFGHTVPILLHKARVLWAARDFVVEERRIIFLSAAHDEDLEVASVLVDRMLKIYPNGVYFLMFKGKLEEIKGNFTEV